MNDVVKNFKKGHKIHIKESLKGTFTKWCGGNVTDECILRGKNSSNPKIRKKATFAANARKWKHLNGGNIITPEMLKNHYLGEITQGKTFGDKVKDIGRAFGQFIPFIGTGLDTEERLGYAAAVGAMKDSAIPTFTYAANNKLSNRTYRGWDRRRHVNKNYGKPYVNVKVARPLAKGLGIAGLILDTPNMVADIENLKRALGFNYNHLLIMKEKDGGIIKAADGTNTSSFWLKAGNFLNSDTGKGIISLGSLVFNGIKTGKDIANFSNSFDAATDSKIKAMESKMKADSYKQGLLKAKQYILLKQLENPDVHYGEIDLTNMALNFANEFYDTEAIEDYKTQRANEKLLTMLAIQGSANTGFSDILQKGLGMVGNYFGNKSSSTTTSNITPNTTSNTTLNLLNTSTIGKSTNPYMYTGLGANYNASTFFK